jgi:glycosyltransferase involved in cell wall biosynthesis
MTVRSVVARERANSTAAGANGGVPPLRGRVLLIGPLPPPMMGPAVVAEMMRDALESAGATVIHVNTRDRRTVFNVGVLDLRNVALGLVHVSQTAWLALRHRVGLVYVPISQGRWGYARDAVLIVIARVLGKRIVVHFHGANFQEFYRSSSAFERSVIRRTLGWADSAIVLTPGLTGAFDGLVAPDRVRVLENAVSDPWPGGIEELQVERRRRALDDPGGPNLLYLANDFAQKGFRTMIRVLAQPGLERALLRMVGAPPAEVAAEAEFLAQQLGVRSRVELTGEQLDGAKRGQFEWADVFAYPTENDGQPLAVIEAMAAGLPIVTTTYGGVPDTVGGTGILVEPRDEVAFGAALRSLIDDVPRREALGAAARERFLEWFTQDAFNRRVAVLFHELLGEAA